MQAKPSIGLLRKLPVPVNVSRTHVHSCFFLFMWGESDSSLLYLIIDDFLPLDHSWQLKLSVGMEMFYSCTVR